jgi:hypothetical protein
VRVDFCALRSYLQQAVRQKETESNQFAQERAEEAEEEEEEEEEEKEEEEEEGGGLLLSTCFSCGQTVFEVLQQLFPLLVVVTALTLVPVFGAN